MTSRGRNVPFRAVTWNLAGLAGRTVWSRSGPARECLCCGAQCPHKKLSDTDTSRSCQQQSARCLLLDLFQATRHGDWSAECDYVESGRSMVAFGVLISVHLPTTTAPMQDYSVPFFCTMGFDANARMCGLIH